MATQGMDPSDIIVKISDVIKARQKGVAIEDAIEKIFRPEELPPAGATQVEQTSPAPAAPVGGLPPQQQQGGLQSLLSSLTAGGQASASARTVVRR
jgi:hypothetical protein